MTNDNKLIAEFMKFQRTEKGYIVGGLGDGTFGFAEELKFHTSWDWLMLVIDKIEIEGFDPHNLIDNALGSREIEDVYDACLTCIKALNSHAVAWDEHTRIEEGLDHKG
tara:strand:- start:45 stop:371 length:327 start_codon:yes stop_codon:yes gene_type:complete